MPTGPSSYTRGLLVTVWMVTGLATISLGARLYTRYWRFSRFYWDDLFVFLGWIFSVPLAAQLTVASRHDTTISHGYQNTFLSRPITQLFFYNCLWAIKLSFLIFFRRIGVTAIPAVKRYWNIVFVLTILAYIGIWMLNPYHCWATKGLASCDRDQHVAPMLSVATAFDVITDCLIVAVPFMIVSHIKLAVRQKLILYSLFSFELVIMVVAIIRVVIAARGITNKQFQIALLLFLTHIEANTAIIVACAGTLRSLFTQKGERSQTPAPWDSRPPNGDIVRLPGDTRFAAHVPPRKSSDDEVVLTHNRHAKQPSGPFETDIPIDLGNLLKKP